MILETQRLILRELTPDDYNALYAVLSDSDIMEHYPYIFDETRVRSWITRNIDRYEKDGFGLWAVVLKETGEMIGDCGVTMQNIHGAMLPEIGYHIRKDQQRKGYASEAAAACIRWAFENNSFPAVYSYMKYTNIPSQRTAEKNSMKFVEEYAEPGNGFTRVYSIQRKDWEQLMKHDSQSRAMLSERFCKESFVVIGKEGSTEDGIGFVQRLWDDANSCFAEVAHLAKKDENGNLVGIWGAMTDFSRSFLPWEDNFSKGLYLAGVECEDDAQPPEGWSKWVVPGFEYLCVECDHDTVFRETITRLREENIPLAGAVHDFTCPATGKNMMFFPIKKL